MTTEMHWGMKTGEVSLDWLIFPVRTIATIYQVTGKSYIYIHLRGARPLRIMLDWPEETTMCARDAANDR